MNKSNKAGLAIVTLCLAVSAIQHESSAQSTAQLTVKEVMNAIITPMPNTIWGAYQLETDAQWQSVENAAFTVISAGNLLASAV